jgi:hypothetical protein
MNLSIGQATRPDGDIRNEFLTGMKDLKRKLI